eukprot:CAMPEP_0185274800 /NCGR_PEP_ID=MMETSP1359-20130426/52653_1 /TAXON_ID=552665 /ORGANISM="Bigelowiella longifila, Strain CCMP242" /LENGTH=249 /DNA_ID=CAMNT_0027867905 /DNA_START=99 /DNA_END=848 /DNA_ORIENTATION=+
MAVVSYKTPFKRQKEGICSSWLASLEPKEGKEEEMKFLVPVSFSKGSFRMPADRMKPVIMVGPGTGIAPFMAMCQQRQHLLLQSEIRRNGVEPSCDTEKGAATSNRSGSSSDSSIYVFFGNRYRKKDFLYQKEWNEMCGAAAANGDDDDDAAGKEQRTVAGFYAAFSRDTAKKVYVQHKLAEQKEMIWEVLGKRQGYFMLAGNAQKMPDDVRNQVREIVRVMGKMTEKEAKLFMLRLDSKRRYVQETWA